MKSLNPFILLFSILLVTAGCEKALNLEKPAADPVALFEEAWKQIDEGYALFPIKKVDWKGVYEQYRPQISAQMSERQLFDTISSMLFTLEDGHVAIHSNFDSSAYEGFYQNYPRNFNWSNIQNVYLGNQYTTVGPFIVKVDDGVGYIYYGSFSSEIEEQHLERLTGILADTKGLILDVRDNRGGSSENVNKLFRYFLKDTRLVKTELRKNGPAHEAYGNPVQYRLGPSRQTYFKPVILLTNRVCFSACNDFVSYMANLEGVTLVGDQTGGGGSIPYNYVLANGWTIYYSASITFDQDNQYIDKGIVPDIRIDISPGMESAGRDPILEKGLELLD